MVYFFNENEFGILESYSIVQKECFICRSKNNRKN